MRNASAALISLLNTNSQLAVTDCLTIVQQNGTITRLTNGDVGVSTESQYDSAVHTFLPTFPFRRGPTKLVTGTEVDNLAVTLYPDPITDLLGGLPWPAAARAGVLDNAEVILEKLIMEAFGDTTPGTLILFWGRVGSPSFDRGAIQLDVKAELILLRNQMPRNVFQPGCLHALFDAGCTLNEGSFTDTGTVSSGSTNILIKTNSGQATGYFNLGAIEFTSGALNGLRVPVRSYTLPSVNDGQFVPMIKLPSAPANGVTWSAIPGCDKKLTTCDTKFSNETHFRGFPVIPSAETAR